MKSNDPLMWVHQKTLQARECAKNGDVSKAYQLMNEVIEYYESTGNVSQKIYATLNQARIIRSGSQLSLGQIYRTMEKVSAAKDIALSKDLLSLAIDCDRYLLKTSLMVENDELIDEYASEILVRLINLRRSLSQDSDRIRFADEIVGLISECVSYYLEKGKIIRAFELQEWVRTQAFTDILVEKSMDEYSELIDFTKTKELLLSLKRPTVLVTMAVINDGLVFFALKPEHEKPSVFQTDITQSDLQNLINTYEREVITFRGRSTDLWIELARDMFSKIEHVIDQDILVILIPHGDLLKLPLHAIQLSNGQPLIAKASVVYIPNITSLKILISKKTREVKFNILSIGVGKTSGPKPVRMFEDEARAIIQRFPGMCLSGKEIPKSEIKRHLPTANILHFSCHGLFDSENYMESGLVLTTKEKLLKKNILSFRDLLGWQLEGQLVTLSACGTTRGTITPSDFLDLGRGFLSAGASAVIATLWSVNTDSTTQLMLSFYDNLRSQKENGKLFDYAEALRKAQQKLAKKLGYYDWAGFKLIGAPSES
ncbi:MAG: CHAT domain-containing protein [Candidatus Thorarchaeota archaeon]